MLPKHFHKTITGLDETQLTELVGRILQEDLRRLGQRAEQLVYSQEVKTGDDGLDGKGTDAPAGSVLPEGLSGWQFKAVSGGPAKLGLAKELAKAGPKDVLNSDGTYVLVWNKELNPKQYADLEKLVADEAKKVSKGPKTVVWGAAQIADLCAKYPGVPFSMGIWNPGFVLNFEQWVEMLHRNERPYEPDEERVGVVEEIRKRLRESSGGLVVRVAGDSGVGKTRTVAEALAADEFRDSTFYAPSVNGLDDFLQLMIETEGAEAIVVVDEVTAEGYGSLQEKVDATGGRVRLVTIGLRASYRSLASHNELILGGLDRDALKRIVQSQAEVPDSVADFVAEATEGYPQMAFEILQEVIENEDAADLSKLAQTTQPRELMKKSVPEDMREALGVLALFHSVGCRGDLEFHLDALAEHFGPTKQQFLNVIENADDRYIRIAGRHCYVRPKLVATWLAGEIIDQLGDDLIEIVNQLPDGLQDAFVQRFEEFGSGGGSLQRVIANFIKQSDRFSDPPDFDEAAGRFLRAAAAVAPQEVVSRIHELVHRASPEQLNQLPRRDLVWALEYLLWWEDTWELAIESLLRLAVYENETWANNATGQFVDAFQLLLGGTLVPHSVRLAWLKKKVHETTDPKTLTLLAQASGAGLRTYVSRSSGVFRGQLEPADWRPTSREEEIAGWGGSWQLLVDMLDLGHDDVAEEATKILVEHVRGALQIGLLDRIDADLRKRAWPDRARAEFAGQLRNVRRYDELPPEIDKQLGELMASLEGEGLEQRLKVLFETKPWDLIEGADFEATPPVIEQLTTEVVDGGKLADAIEVSRTAPDEGSAFAFFATLAQKLGAETVGRAAFEADPPAWPAVAAGLARADAQDEGAWADKLLEEAAAKADKQFPELVRSAGLNPHRALLVVKRIRDGTFPGHRFAGLLFGAGIRKLEWPAAEELMRTIATDESAGSIESVLGMLHQWVEVNPDQKDRVVDLLSELSLKAGAAPDPSTMLSHYLEQLLVEVPIPFETRAETWRQRVLHSGVSAPHEERSVIAELLKDEPEQAADLIVDMLLKAVSPPYQKWAFSLEKQALLSKGAETTSAGRIWSRLEALPDRQLRFLLRHFSWSGAVPDSLVREFLLSKRRGELATEGFVNFFNDLGVVSGPYHLALERELERAKSWRDSLKDTDAEAWADELVRDYEQRIPQWREREEEEDLRLR